MKETVNYWNEVYEKKGLDKTLIGILEKYNKEVYFSTSLGLEDQVLLDKLVKLNQPFQIFTLDTGRLFQETYELWEKTERHYQIKIEPFFPNFQEVEKMVKEKGINLFYKSVENRKLCCAVRKLEPLSRALKQAKIWLTGLRREQSPTRNEMKFAEWEEKYNLLKINPLIDWSLEQVWDYVKKEKVPYNPLHDENFPSIGCAPCTRAILPGEDIRAGRWWWENPTTKECGLHISKTKS
jgi:phosphoadenosine phosphosulfate reductase